MTFFFFPSSLLSVESSTFASLYFTKKEKEESKKKKSKSHQWRWSANKKNNNKRWKQ